MKSHSTTSTVYFLLLLALGAASIGYGLVHPDSVSIIFGIINIALSAGFYTAIGRK